MKIAAVNCDHLGSFVLISGIPTLFVLQGRPKENLCFVVCFVVCFMGVPEGLSRSGLGGNDYL